MVKRSFYRQIARRRIKELFELAKDEARKGRLDRADRYVEIARKIGMRYLVRIPKEYRLLFCKRCHKFLLPGVNCRVRINRKKLVIFCYNCKGYRRIPLKIKDSERVC
ncbi:MAG TPA: hypothetical protein ENG60_01695 [Thermoplasmatales archaeon]|nr:hypothetical protein [Thermoplasmatales archaeon]HEX17117.1 hypothetical protein [Thermoplasmatales archaeon]